MFSVDLQALTHQVRTVLADPSEHTPHTGDLALDEALTDLGRRRREGKLYEAPLYPFWTLQHPTTRIGCGNNR